MASKAAPRRSAPTQADLEAEIAASRARLAGNVDQLTNRLQPKALLASTTDAAKARAFATVSDDSGSLDLEKVGKIVGGVSAGVLALGVLRRIFR
ncbi:uncharacterized protein DUF3618 [Branchiibius hedensis]|uniref:DUF3618 domain-containing protein n=1 Tax=Branchiibius hedensis TaxID=672460 RepID=A0A2Y8ZSV1_9MICO|nr:DUF3618 domain-containing protein [Branchiibius hedensis]PWJ24562.1 uncharacterized protein DUF3618 [Branchiibius hedensis]SSA33379.1 Protein of unknown function [Branchiibius hedensis]